MLASNEKFLVGLVGPEVLSAVEADATHPVSIDIGACNALEIRYDFFPEKEWPALSKRVRKIAPHAMQVGTIRLERDGGRFPDRDAYSRIPLWSKILAEGDVPEWLDLEQDCLYDFKNLKNLADLRKTRVLVSQHNFLRIPSQQELDDFARDCLRVKADGQNVHLWDGIEDPYLYEAKAEFGGDVVSTKFGCRTIEFDADKGFILNGRAYPLRGVSRHQDRKGLGNALTTKEHKEDMEFIREIGANTVRLAHYQHAQEFYDLCDEYGIIAWAEIPYITAHMPNGRQNTIDQMRELITQCYNHPAIVCWGLSNEITASGTVSDDLLDNHRVLNDLCHAMDKTRPTTMAHVFMLETDSPLIDIPDIGSYNLYFGWYIGELEQNDKFFDDYHKKFPTRVIGFSEYGADANPQYQSKNAEKGDYSETYQCVYHEHLLKCIEEHPYLWATHAWNLFDFAADGRDEGGKNGENQKGLVTFDRKLRKDAFYLYKAHWSKEPFVHLCGSRYVDRAEEKTEIKVYSNQSEVTLLVDGKEVATKTGGKIYTFQIPLTGERVITAKSGELSDTMIIRKAEKANPSYRMVGGEVVNWFDADTFDPTCFSIKDTLGALMQHPKAGAIVGRMMQAARASRGDVASATAGNANLERMMAGMTLQSLLKQAGPAIKPEQIQSLNAALQQIKK